MEELPPMALEGPLESSAILSGRDEALTIGAEVIGPLVVDVIPDHLSPVFSRESKQIGALVFALQSDSRPAAAEV